MQQILFAIIAVVVVYAGVMFLLPKRFLTDPAERTKRELKRLTGETATADYESLAAEEVSYIRSEFSVTPLGRVVMALPGGQGFYELILKSGFSRNVAQVLLAVLLLFLVLVFVVMRFSLGWLGLIAAVVISYMLPRTYLKRRIEARNDRFINMFPDALDMIVRSVRSGFPLNTALKMIADNMDPPVSTEFRQVVDEIAYGRSMNEALQRLGQRMDRPDIQFFIVMLTVQQESGGNLSEVMTNLANIIRRRKHLRQKIKAMTSEGRATAWVLGAIPVFLFIALRIVAPHHLEPLFTTVPGKIVLATAAGLVVGAFWIVRQMVKIDI